MHDVDDEYLLVYTLDGDTWTTAFDFDRQRDRQKPSSDVYQRAKTGAAKPAR